METRSRSRKRTLDLAEEKVIIEEKVNEEILVEKEEEPLIVMGEPEANPKALMDYFQPKINNQSGESLSEAWDRYKEMLRKFPHHGMPEWMIINCFYNGLGATSRPMLNTTSGGALWDKSYDDAYELIELMAVNEYQNPTQRLSQGKVAGILELDAATAIAAQLKALTMKVDSLSNYGFNQITSISELCAGAYETDQCAISSESAQFVSNFQRSQQPVRAIYHPNNCNHLNFRWSNTQNAVYVRSQCVCRRGVEYKQYRIIE
ncbi:hypothetical protein AgCh_038727 [Apium graveolens]